MIGILILGSNITSNSTNLLNQWVMLSMELDIPNNRVTASLNTTPYATNVTQSGLSTMGTGSIRLNDYQNNADSDWGEIIFTEDTSQANSEKIEGYLAHKWGLAGDLPSAHPYKAYAPNATPWSPLTLSPTLWFDADDASTITTSGSSVTAWNDKSGNNDHPTTLTNVTQSGTIGGKNTMTFGTYLDNDRRFKRLGLARSNRCR